MEDRSCLECYEGEGGGALVLVWAWVDNALMKQMRSWMVETAMVAVIMYKMKRLVPEKIKIKVMVMFSMRLMVSGANAKLREIKV